MNEVSRSHFDLCYSYTEWLSAAGRWIRDTPCLLEIPLLISFQFEMPHTLAFSCVARRGHTRGQKKMMFKPISDVFRGKTRGSLDILDISQSFPQGAWVVSYFSIVFRANYNRMVISFLVFFFFFLTAKDLSNHLKCKTSLCSTLKSSIPKPFHSMFLCLCVWP